VACKGLKSRTTVKQWISRLISIGNIKLFQGVPRINIFRTVDLTQSEWKHRPTRWTPAFFTQGQLLIVIIKLSLSVLHNLQKQILSPSGWILNTYSKASAKRKCLLSEKKKHCYVLHAFKNLAEGRGKWTDSYFGHFTQAKKPLVSLMRRMSRPPVQFGRGDRQRNPCHYNETVIKPIQVTTLIFNCNCLRVNTHKFVKMPPCLRI
jgi:hypothetical protein